MSQRRVHTFTATLEDRPGVLNRVISLFRRRGYNIESLTVGRCEKPGVSRLTLVVAADDDTARLLEANLYKLVNVLHVEDITHAPSVVRELALLKLSGDAKRRPELMQLCEAIGVHILDVTPAVVTAEITGTMDKVDQALEVLAPFGLLEVVRTGAVAITRSEKPPPFASPEETAGEADGAGKAARA